MEPRYAVRDDIARTSTPDRAYRHDAAVRETVRERVFARARLRPGDLAEVVPAGSLAPVVASPVPIDETRLRAPDSRHSP